jgi:ATP-dependent RNA helicase RhlE
MGKVVPDYPRAEGIDLGAEPLRLDPARDPRQKLPGKKARKKMAEERAARREARRAAGEQAAGGRGTQVKASKPKNSKPKAAKSARTPQKSRRRSTSRNEAMPFGPSGKPKRSAAKKLSRHPGDRGGRRG